MDISLIFAIVCGVIFTGFIAEQIMKRFKIPDVLLLLFVGILLSQLFNIKSITEFENATSLFTTFALVFILFQGALRINFKTLLKSLPKTFGITLLSFILTFVVGSIISYSLGFSLPIAVLIGAILGGTSSSIVIPLVQSVEIREKYGLVLKLESALSDVLCIVTALTILEVIQSGNLVASAIFRSILTSFSLAVIVGGVFGFIWTIVESRFEVLSKVYVVTIAAVMGVFAFVESPFVQGSGAIAALAFGLVLGNSRSILKKQVEEKKVKEDKITTNILTPSARNFFDEIYFFVKTFFFVYLGILIDFSNPEIFVSGLLLTLAMFVIRPVVVAIMFKDDSSMDTKERTFLEILIPKGLAAAVLAGLSVQTGVIGTQAGNFTTTILSVILLSIIMTSILVFLTEKNWFSGIFPFLRVKNKE